MILSSKVTWGLAWTGLAVILAVPSADVLTAALKPSKSAALVTSTTDPVQPGGSTAAKPATSASVTTTVTKSGVIITPAAAPKTASTDPVKTYLDTKKALPDYLTDASGKPGTATSPATGTQVAAIDPATQTAAPVTAPIPFPARPTDLIGPRQQVTTAPAKPALSVDQTTTGSIAAPPVVDAPIVNAPVVVTPPVQQATRAPAPPAAIVDDSANWRANGLTTYLERNGLINEDGSTQSTATVTTTEPSDYDPDGFYLSDGPNTARASRRARVLETFGDDPNGPVPPANFNLF